jgi:bifunctional non-homologous end joining protein LigD
MQVKRESLARVHLAIQRWRVACVAWKRSSPRREARRPVGFVEPCLPTRYPKPPAGEGWLHEIKQDGYRLLVNVASGRVTLWTRNGFDWTDRYPTVVAGAAALAGRDVLIDGEVVVQDDLGRADFDALHLTRSANPAAVLFAFDLLRPDGKDLRRAPLEERRAELSALVGTAPLGIAFSARWIGEGAAIFKAACEMGLEGIVSERLGSRYQSGASDAWRKTICERTERVTVTDFAEPENDGPVLFVAREAAGRLEPAGYVSLTGEGAEALLDRVKAQAGAVRRRHKGRVPVEPGIALDVTHRGPPGRLRHAKIVRA